MLGFLLTVLLVASPALAEAALAQTGKSASPSLTEPSLSEIVNAVQERYQRTTSFRATFEQEAYNKSLGRTRTANGRVSIVRPGKMRWQYVKPDKRLIVSDGQTLWLYFPENNQVMVGDATRQSGFVRVFLAGDGKLGEDFEIEAAPKGAAARDGQMAEANEYGLQLRPKNPNTNVT